jgi:hypothetical protein
MYTKKFTALEPDQIKKVNASALAKKFQCSSQYVSRVLKSTEEPKNEKAQQIFSKAVEIIEYYESIKVEQ